MIASLRYKFGNSALRAAMKYKNSRIQAKMHEFQQNTETINAQKQKLDYDTINKQSEGCIMIREFLFQQKRPAYQVNYPDSYLVPSGKWSLKEMQKLDNKDFQEREEKTASEQQNLTMLNSLEPQLKEKFGKYYENIGKRNYTFSVKQEVQKIEEMTAEEFEAFILKLKS